MGTGTPPPDRSAALSDELRELVARCRAAQAEPAPADTMSVGDAWPLVKVIELKDGSTAAHTWRVVLYARVMAEDAGLEPAFIDRLSIAAALHDVGKIDIEDAVLKKPGPLSDDERSIIERHPIDGYDRLVAMGVRDPVVLGLVRWHHERLDGRGYPDALAGDDIPTAARYFAVIDTFDAMTSLRPYRSSVGREAAERAIADLEFHAGTAYDAAAVARLATLYRAGAFDWIMRYYNDDATLPDLDLTPAR